MKKPTTIVFITGAFVSHHVWDNWKRYFEDKGFTTLAPPWPYKDASVQELRNRQPNDTALAKLRLSELTDHYIKIVADLAEKPLVIGHSLGGLIAQILVNREFAAAGVAIHSVPPKGVFSFEWSFLKSIWKPLGFFSSVKKTHLMSLREWKYAFTNGMDEAQQVSGYETYCIPESKQVLRDALTSMAMVDFMKPHPPLLFITGTTDHITPNSLVYENYLKYNKNHSVTDYKEFKGKNHFVLGLPTWHDEADYIVSWIDIISDN
ncbi:alpha/beta hydrolase [Flavobacterium sp. RHBU_24]|uniref:alpha/beta hydrolase n=1 Tax=Flavobacterium sp. RHBU_24 TaxID=3391185 RepID=UPI0039851D14